MKSLVLASLVLICVIALGRAEPSSDVSRCYRPPTTNVSCVPIASPRFRAKSKNASIASLPAKFASQENAPVRAGYCERLPDYCRTSDWNF